MAAVDHVHPVQMKLFMGAQEWQESVTESVDRPTRSINPQTMEDVWTRKLAESKKSKPSIEHGAGIHQAISEQGYQHNENDPPTILLNQQNEQVQHEGHHRIAAAADIERSTGKNIWIPTNYRERDW